MKEYEEDLLGAGLDQENENIFKSFDESLIEL